jgi:hypothetical protein
LDAVHSRTARAAALLNTYFLERKSSQILPECYVFGVAGAVARNELQNNIS